MMSTIILFNLKSLYLLGFRGSSCKAFLCDLESIWYLGGRFLGEEKEEATNTATQKALRDI